MPSADLTELGTNKLQLRGLCVYVGEREGGVSVRRGFALRGVRVGGLIQLTRRFNCTISILLSILKVII